MACLTYSDSYMTAWSKRNFVYGTPALVQLLLIEGGRRLLYMFHPAALHQSRITVAAGPAATCMVCRQHAWQTGCEMSQLLRLKTPKQVSENVSLEATTVQELHTITASLYQIRSLQRKRAVSNTDSWTITRITRRTASQQAPFIHD